MQLPRTPHRRPPLRGLVLALSLAACTAVGPDYEPPQPDLPEMWRGDLDQGLRPGFEDLSTWWEKLGDPKLTELVHRALAENRDITVAVARVQEARARRGIAESLQVPAVNAAGEVSRQRYPAPFGTTLGIQERFQAGLGLSWELDVFGAVRRTVEASIADLQSVDEALRDIEVIVTSEVALTYVQVRALQARIEIAERNIATQEEALRLASERNRVGLSPELDVAQAATNLANTQAFVPLLRFQLASAMNRLAVLMGEEPGPLQDELAETAPLPAVPEEILVSLPAELLRQRPDIRAAERALAAQTARVGVATAELYPRFQLAGDMGLSSVELDDFFSDDARFWNLRLPFQWRLFEGGRIRAEIAVEDARVDAALATYEQTVLLALEEVENTLVGYVQQRFRAERLTEAVAAAQRSVELSNSLYTSGQTDFQRVLDAQRVQASAEDDLEVTRQQGLENLINFYRAMGGGWNWSSAEFGDAAPAPGPVDGTPEEMAEEPGEDPSATDPDGNPPSDGQ